MWFSLLTLVACGPERINVSDTDTVAQRTESGDLEWGTASSNQNDNDADTATDPSASDRDGDGYGDNIDCDDSSSAIYPGATEIDNDLDDDCDGDIDEGFDGDDTDDDTDQETDTDDDADFVDSDGDGYTPDAGDCNDRDDDINPGEDEVPGNDTDENCDGSEDEEWIFVEYTPMSGSVGTWYLFGWSEYFSDLTHWYSYTSPLATGSGTAIDSGWLLAGPSGSEVQLSGDWGRSGTDGWADDIVGAAQCGSSYTSRSADGSVCLQGTIRVTDQGTTTTIGSANLGLALWGDYMVHYLVR